MLEQRHVHSLTLKSIFEKMINSRLSSIAIIFGSRGMHIYIQCEWTKIEFTERAPLELSGVGRSLLVYPQDYRSSRIVLNTSTSSRKVLNTSRCGINGRFPATFWIETSSCFSPFYTGERVYFY